MIAQCPDCKSESQRPDSDVGKTIICAKCFFTFVIPKSASTNISTVETRIEPAKPAYSPTTITMPNTAALPQTLVPASPPNVGFDTFVVCPRCNKATDHLKAIEIRNFYFLLLFFYTNRELLIGCPSCVRKELLFRLLAAIPFANILFPLSAIGYLMELALVRANGHSDLNVALAHRMTPSQHQEAEWSADNSRGSPLVKWIVVTMLVLFIGLIGFGVWYRVLRN